jgi:hypothetical protein
MRKLRIRSVIELGAVMGLLALTVTTIPAGASPPLTLVTGAGVGVSVGSVIGQLTLTNGECVDNSGPISVGPSAPLAAGVVSNIEFHVTSSCQVVIVSANLNAVATPSPTGGTYTTVTPSPAAASQSTGPISATCTGESGWVKTTDLDDESITSVTESEVRQAATWSSCGGTPYLTENTNSSDTYCYNNIAMNTTTLVGGTCAHTVTNTSFDTGYMRGQGMYEGLCDCGTNLAQSTGWTLYGQFNVSVGVFSSQGGLDGGTLPNGDYIDVQASHS